MRRFLLLYTALLLLSACREDDLAMGGTEQLRLTVDLKTSALNHAVARNGTRGEASSTVAVVTIKDGEDAIYDHKALQLFADGSGHRASAYLSVMPDRSYTIESCVVTIDDQDLATPDRGSELAQYVNTPLPISFEVVRGHPLQTLSLEVLPADDVAAEYQVDYSRFVRIPDKNFRTYLISRFKAAFFGRWMDPSNPSVLEAEQIDVHGRQIPSLQGIECFTGLKILKCDDNQLGELKLAKNEKLTYLSCSSNQLTELKLESQEQLETLYCQRNKLKVLDISPNKSATSLHCAENQLTDLTLSNNLRVLDCSGNKLTRLDLSQNTDLNELYCQNNPLTELDIRKLKKEADDEKLQIYGGEGTPHQLRTLRVHEFSENHEEFKDVKRTTPEAIISTYDDDDKQICSDYDPIAEQCKDGTGDKGGGSDKAVTAGGTTTVVVSTATAFGYGIKKVKDTKKVVGVGSQTVEMTERTPSKEISSSSEEETPSKEDPPSSEEEESITKKIVEEAKEEAKEEAVDQSEQQACESMSDPDKKAICEQAKQAKDLGKTGFDLSGAGQSVKKGKSELGSAQVETKPTKKHTEGEGSSEITGETRTTETTTTSSKGTTSKTKTTVDPARIDDITDSRPDAVHQLDNANIKGKEAKELKTNAEKTTTDADDIIGKVERREIKPKSVHVIHIRRKLLHQRTHLSKEIEERYSAVAEAGKSLEAVEVKISKLESIETALKREGKLDEGLKAKLDTKGAALVEEEGIREDVSNNYRQQIEALTKARDGIVIKQSALNQIAPTGYSAHKREAVGKTQTTSSTTTESKGGTPTKQTEITEETKTTSREEVAGETTRPGEQPGTSPRGATSQTRTRTPSTKSDPVTQARIKLHQAQQKGEEAENLKAEVEETITHADEIIGKLKREELAPTSQDVCATRRKLRDQRTHLSKEIEERYDSAKIARKPLDAVKRKIEELPEGERESLSKELERRSRLFKAYRRQEKALIKTRDDLVIKLSALNEIAPPNVPTHRRRTQSVKDLRNPGRNGPITYICIQLKPPIFSASI